MRESRFRAKLRHEIVIPSGPEDRPGERLRAPSRSLHPPMPAGPDGSRTDFRVVISRRRSTFGAVCLGPVSERRDPEASAHHTIRAFAERGSTVASRIEHEPVAGEPGVRYQIELGTRTLVEWKFAHRDWLFVAGVLCHRADNVTLVARSREILGTWIWIDNPTNDSPRPTPPPLWSTEASVSPPGWPA